MKPFLLFAAAAGVAFCAWEAMPTRPEAWKPYGEGEGMSGQYGEFCPVPMPPPPPPGGEEPDGFGYQSAPSFDECWEYVKANEGGFTVDTGGPTFQGVTAATAKRFGYSDPRQADAKAIFRKYYEDAKISSLPPDLQLIAGDFCYWKPTICRGNISTNAREKDVHFSCKEKTFSLRFWRQIRPLSGGDACQD